MQARWGTVPLIDMLKEAVLRTGCLKAVTTVADRGGLPKHVLAERLQLAIYGCGTTTGIRAVAGGEHGHLEDEIRYARWRYLTPGGRRQIAIEISNDTLTPEDRRGLTPRPFWTHVLPYGEVKLNMTSRLALTGG